MASEALNAIPLARLNKVLFKNSSPFYDLLEYPPATQCVQRFPCPGARILLRKRLRKWVFVLTWSRERHLATWHVWPEKPLCHTTSLSLQPGKALQATIPSPRDSKNNNVARHMMLALFQATLPFCILKAPIFQKLNMQQKTSLVIAYLAEFLFRDILVKHA